MTPARLVGVLATVVGLALLLPGAGLPRASTVPALVAIQYDSSPASLVRVDAVSLQRVDSAAVRLDPNAGGWKVSPDGTKVAFGNNQAFVLRTYDLAQMKLESSVTLGAGSGFVNVIAWPAADRLLALVQRCCSPAASVVSVDPESGRVVGRVALPGAVRDWAPTRNGAVLLVAPRNRIGSARLAVVDADGVVRWVTVARVRVGFSPKPTPARGRVMEPGLAVDVDGGRVFLVPASGPVAQVGLGDLDVAYHAIRHGARRLAAAQKEFRGPWRDAQYLGGGLLAVSGYEGVRKHGKFAFVAAGLMLVDPRDWTERTVDRTSSWFTVAPPLLLVIHAPDVVAYSVDGRVRFQVTIGQPLGLAAAVGSHAYVWRPDNRIVVLDLVAGTVVNTTEPTSLMPIAAVPG